LVFGSGLVRCDDGEYRSIEGQELHLRDVRDIYRAAVGTYTTNLYYDYGASRFYVNLMDTAGDDGLAVGALTFERKIASTDALYSVVSFDRYAAVEITQGDDLLFHDGTVEGLPETPGFIFRSALPAGVELEPEIRAGTLRVLEDESYEWEDAEIPAAFLEDPVALVRDPGETLWRIVCMSNYPTWPQGEGAWDGADLLGYLRWSDRAGSSVEYVEYQSLEGAEAIEGADVAEFRVGGPVGDGFTEGMWSKTEATWNVRRTGVGWTGGQGPNESGASRAIGLARPGSGASGIVPSRGVGLAVDVTGLVRDYIENAGDDDPLSLRAVFGFRDGGDSGTVLATRMHTCWLWLTDLQLDIQYTAVYGSVAPGYDASEEEGLLSAVPWQLEHGPLGLPYIARGAGLAVWGHAGARPQVYWRGAVFPAGLRAPERAPTLTPVAGGGNMAAGSYDYTITRYDSTLGRVGESLLYASVTVAEGGSVEVDAESFVASEVERYDSYHVWRRSESEANFYLVGTLAAAVAEADGFEDTAATPELTALVRGRYAMPAFREVVWHRGRFWGLGLEDWQVAGTTLAVTAGSVQVTASGAAPRLGQWMARRTLLLKDPESGVWSKHLVLSLDVSGEDVIRLRLAAAWAGATGDAQWRLEGDAHTVFVGERRISSVELFRLDGTTQISVAPGDGQELVSARTLGDRLMVYKTNGIYVVMGGGWADSLDETPPINDLDYYQYQAGVGLVGPYALALDEVGRHWFWAGDDLYLNDGVAVQNMTQGRLKRLLREVDEERMQECGVVYDTSRGLVWVIGWYERTAALPSLGAVYDTRTGAVTALRGLPASCGAMAPVR